MPNAEYMKEYREAHPEYSADMNARKRARGKALTRLAAAQPVLFKQFFQEALEHELQLRKLNDKG